MRRAAALLAAGALLLVAAGAPDPKTETSHVVKAGETLGGIASRAEVPRVLIIEDEPIIALSLACAVEALGLLAQATIDAAIIASARHFSDSLRSG